MELLNCKFAERCSGCPWIQTKYSDQLQKKSIGLSEALLAQGVATPTIEMITVGTKELRDRVDLTIKNINNKTHIGFFDSHSKEILDIDLCLQMSPELDRWFQEFRKNLPPIKLGSVRLRVSPKRERGVWLDFANVDIKYLLEEKTWLSRLLEKATVEIGQKRKVLGFKDGHLKLLSPQPKNWFETYDGDGNAIPLFSAIGGFTQTGFAANKKLVNTILRLVKSTPLKKWTEIFCGSGNFTLAIASLGHRVIAAENDELALLGLERALKDHPEFKVEVNRANVYSAQGLPLISINEGLLVDPPRSGLKQLIDQIGSLTSSERPRAIIYVSCFTDSFSSDCRRLKEHGYQLERIIGIDQFPQGPHAEWVGLLTKNGA